MRSFISQLAHASSRCQLAGLILAMAAVAPAARGRGSSYAGDVAPLVQILMKHIHKPGTIQYASKKNAKLDRASIMPFAELMFDLYDLQNNLSYTQTAMDLALREVAECKSFCKRKPNNVQLFVENVSARIRTMCRHVSQGHVKQTAWVLQMLRIPAGASAAVLEVFDADAEAGPAAVPEADAERTGLEEQQQQHHGQAMDDPSSEDQKQHGQGMDVPPGLEDQQHHGQAMDVPQGYEDQQQQHHGQGMDVPDNGEELAITQGTDEHFPVETQVDSGVDGDSELDDEFPCTQASSSAGKRKAGSNVDSDVEQDVKQKKLRADGESADSGHGGDSSSSTGPEHEEVEEQPPDDVMGAEAAPSGSPFKPKVIGLKPKKSRKKVRKTKKVRKSEPLRQLAVQDAQAVARIQLRQRHRCWRHSLLRVAPRRRVGHVQFALPHQKFKALPPETPCFLPSLHKKCMFSFPCLTPKQKKIPGVEGELCTIWLWSTRFAWGGGSPGLAC